MTTRRLPKYQGLLANLRDVIGRYSAQSLKLPAEQATAFAEGLVSEIASYFGGRPVYLPRGALLDSSMRACAIWDAFTGDNVDELATQFGLTRARIYQILAEQRTARRPALTPKQKGSHETD